MRGCLILFIMLFSYCNVDNPEIEYCGRCYSNISSDTLCGTYREVNDWFYEYYLKNTQGGEWECTYIK